MVLRLVAVNYRRTKARSQRKEEHKGANPKYLRRTCEFMRGLHWAQAASAVRFLSFRPRLPIPEFQWISVSVWLCAALSQSFGVAQRDRPMRRYPWRSVRVDWFSWSLLSICVRHESLVLADPTVCRRRRNPCVGQRVQIKIKMQNRTRPTSIGCTLSLSSEIMKATPGCGHQHLSH
jgi:hypothetical protein